MVSEVWARLRQSVATAASSAWRHMAVLSQMTENRKVEARKPLIFQHTIFAFGLEKANLRQNP
jgi:hypothetical protein